MPTAKKRAVWVVETYLSQQKRWYAWSARTGRKASWDDAQGFREQYPGHKFRVTKYESSKP